MISPTTPRYVETGWASWHQLLSRDSATAQHGEGGYSPFPVTQAAYIPAGGTLLSIYPVAREKHIKQGTRRAGLASADSCALHSSITMPVLLPLTRKTAEYQPLQQHKSIHKGTE